MHKAQIEVRKKYHRATEEAQLKQYQINGISDAFSKDVMDGKDSCAANASILRTVKGGSVRNKLPDIEFYDMDRENRGLHLIFAERNFEDSVAEKCTGIEADVKALENAFEHLGFENAIHEYKSIAEVKNILTTFSSMNHSANDCIAITLLTSRDNRGLYARDDPFPVDDLWMPFEADVCKGLAGRPKVFIVNYDPVVTFGPDGPILFESCRFAAHNDFIWSFSTHEGDISWRNPDEGSSYIQALCKVILADDNRRMDFASYLMKANQLTDDALHNKTGYDQCMQSPTIISTLRGKVKFPKKKKSLASPSAPLVGENLFSVF